jgi:hypothetical protein
LIENEPQTLIEAIRYFTDPDTCHAFMVTLRWPDGVVRCPTCGSDNVGFLKPRRLFQCKTKHPRQQFSVKVGTIFEDSPIGLDKWLCAMWMIANDKNGISSYEVSRDLGVTQKTAWFLMHRIRLAMQSGSIDKLDGTVEVDETFIGGKARFMHKGKRAVKIQGTGGMRKVAVMGLLDRHGPDGHSHVRTHVLADRKIRTLTGLVRKVHTNGIENFWSLLKRSIKGTYVSVEPFHLFRYLDEQAFRFNSRKLSDGTRFLNLASRIIGKRLTYNDLTGKTPA